MGKLIGQVMLNVFKTLDTNNPYKLLAQEYAASFFDLEKNEKPSFVKFYTQYNLLLKNKGSNSSAIKVNALEQTILSMKNYSVDK